MWIKRRCAELEKRSIKPFRTGWGKVEAVRGCRLLRLLRSDGIGHDRATLAKGLIRTDRRIARGLMFNLGIEFGTEQHNDGRYPQPNHPTTAPSEP